MFPAFCALFIALADYSISHRRSQRNFSVSPRHLRNCPRSKQIVVQEMWLLSPYDFHKNQPFKFTVLIKQLLTAKFFFETLRIQLAQR